MAFCEIHPAACAVLSHKWPAVPNLGDIAKADWNAYAGQVDVVVGGSPCQDFSVAGLRAGLSGDRGNLTLEYLHVIQTARPRWALWENVPGVLSSNAGRDFGAFLGGLAQLGYRFAWRVLDARCFGVAQRRRRVFLVAYAGTDLSVPAEVLALTDGCGGAPATGGGPGEGAAADPGGGPVEYGRLGLGLTRWKRPARRRDGAASDMPAHGVAIRGRDGGATAELLEGTAHCLRLPGGGGSYSMVAQDLSETGQGWICRRLSPVECLRLQGFDDTWLDRVELHGKPLADTHKYHLVGNSWSIPCAAWCLERIDAMDAALSQEESADLSLAA